MRQRLPGVIHPPTYQKTLVRARSNSSQSFDHNTQATIIFNSVDFDTLGEYDSSTGVFTAKQAGVFSFSTSVLFVNVEWVAGTYVNLYGLKNTNTQELFSRTTVSATLTHNLFTQLSGLFRLNAGETFRVAAVHTRGAATALNSTLAWNHISISAL